MKMSMADCIKELRRSPSVSVPLVGWVLGGLGRNASYDAAERGKLGVPTFRSGNRVRCSSAAVLQKLELDVPDFGASGHDGPASLAPAPPGAAAAMPARQAQPVRRSPAAGGSATGPPHQTTSHPRK
jgi:hypothetical protein